MKIAVIGGGSTYTPELVAGLLARAGTLPLTELWLMDTDPARLGVVGGFARRMAEAQGAPFRLVLSDSTRDAVRDSAYVITQLRVGMMAARRGDEYLGQRHGLIGQETTGVGGLAKALRTIPVVLAIADAMRELAPGALLVNFTNPAGLVMEALARHAADVPSVGLCNSGITTSMALLRQLERILERQIDPAEVALDTLGLNHLTWHRGFTVAGEEMWPILLQRYLQRMHDEEDPPWSPALIARLGMIPNSYLQYYYRTADKLAEQAGWPPSRAEEVMAIEETLLADYASPALTDLPPGLMQRGGAWYSTLAADVIAAHYNDLGTVHVVNVPHRGAVPGWDPEWVVELPARVERGGIEGLPARPLPAECAALVATVKRCELLTVTAAMEGDREALREALLSHPLGPDAAHATAVLEDLLQSNRAWLPRFHEGTGG